MWGVKRGSVLLRKESTLKAAIGWYSVALGEPVKTIQQGGCYDLYARSIKSELGPMRVATVYRLTTTYGRATIARYPSPQAPNYWILDSDLDLAEQIHQGLGVPTLGFGAKVPVIIALRSVGWMPVEIARTLETSKDYVDAVLAAPEKYLIPARHFAQKEDTE